MKMICQTLTTGAESNILKWKEIAECISEEEQVRFEEIKSLYNKNKLAKGDDKVGQAVIVLSDLADNLGKIKDAMLVSDLAENIGKIKDVYEKLKPTP